MILRILFPLILLLALPAWGLDRMLLSRKTKRWKRLLFYAPNILLVIALIALSINESYTATADFLKGRILSLVILVVVPEVLLAVLLGLSRLLKRFSPIGARVLAAFAWLVSLTGFGSALCGMTYGYRHVVVKQFDYVNPQLPEAFDGYRIVQISDLHLGTIRGDKALVQKIVDSINHLNPDLVVFTGDLVNYRAEEAAGFVSQLREIEATDGVLSIMGNHDYAQYFRWPFPADSLRDILALQHYEAEMDWKLLLNDNRVIRQGADSIAIVGVENDGRPPFPALADLPQAQSGLADGCFKILLSHDPTHWRRAVVEKTDIALTLSGHTHGMQLKIGSFSPAAWFYDEWGGAYEAETGQTLYISLGTGQVLLPFRLGAWPEINVIKLKKQS